MSRGLHPKLIAELDKLFPDNLRNKSVLPSTPAHEVAAQVHRMVGARLVIDYLKSLGNSDDTEED